VPEPAPIAAAAPAVPETDDERIARMIAAAAANVQRTPRERVPRAERRDPTGEAPSTEVGEFRTRLFGARPAAAEPEPAPPAPEPEAAPVTRIASAADRAGRSRDREPRDRSPAPPITNVPMASAAPVQRETRIERRERPRIAARAVAAPAAAPAMPTTVTGTEQGLVEDAITLIFARASDLAGQVDPDAKVPVDLILEHGRETTEQLSGILSRGTSPVLRRINADLGEVVDLILLMQLEKGHAPADDTLTMLLQLRRELETLRQG
jgi:hypothetical protein